MGEGGESMKVVVLLFHWPFPHLIALLLVLMSALDLIKQFNRSIKSSLAQQRLFVGFKLSKTTLEGPVIVATKQKQNKTFPRIINVNSHPISNFHDILSRDDSQTDCIIYTCLVMQVTRIDCKHYKVSSWISRHRNFIQFG